MGATTNLALDCFTVHSRVGGARNHRVFGGDPALTFSGHPTRNTTGEGRRAEHLGLTKGDQSGTFSLFAPAALDSDFAELVDGTAIKSSHLFSILEDTGITLDFTYRVDMPLFTSIAIIAVVWAVSSVANGPLKALIYSFPIPISMVLLTTNPTMSGRQIIGIVILVCFFYIVGALVSHNVSPLISVIAGVIYYFLASAIIQLLPPPELTPTLGLVFVMWLVLCFKLWRGVVTTKSIPSKQAPPGAKIAKYSLFVGVTISMVYLGQLLGGLMVTFPYSGVLVSYDLGKNAMRFARQFTVTSVNLIIFLATYSYCLEVIPQWEALLFAWLAFGISSVLLLGAIKGSGNAQISISENGTL